MTKLNDNKIIYEGRDLEAMDFAVRYHQWILSIFRPYLGENIVEIGAGSGSFTEVLAELTPKQLTAIEPSNEMYPLLDQLAKKSESPKIKTYKNFFSEVASKIKSSKPSSAVYINVFEHIKDDRAELDLLYKTLPKGAHVCIFVPANEWLMSDFDRSIDHYRRYSKKELWQKVERAGFEVIFGRRFDAAGVLPWWIKFTLMKSKKMEPGLAKVYDNVVVPVERRVEKIVEPPVGKNVILVARRP